MTKCTSNYIFGGVALYNFTVAVVTICQFSGTPKLLMVSHPTEFMTIVQQQHFWETHSLTWTKASRKCVTNQITFKLFGLLDLKEFYGHSQPAKRETVSFISLSQSPPPLHRLHVLRVLFISVWIVGRLSAELGLLKVPVLSVNSLDIFQRLRQTQTHTHKNSRTSMTHIKTSPQRQLCGRDGLVTRTKATIKALPKAYDSHLCMSVKYLCLHSVCVCVFQPK